MVFGVFARVANNCKVYNTYKYISALVGAEICDCNRRLPTSAESGHYPSPLSLIAWRISPSPKVLNTLNKLILPRTVLWCGSVS